MHTIYVLRDYMFVFTITMTKSIITPETRQVSLLGDSITEKFAHQGPHCPTN